MKKVRFSRAIITVDIYNNLQYKYSGGKFFRLSKLKRAKDDTVVTYIANRDLNIESVDLSPNLPEENLLDIITDKVYEELQLDPAVEYEIYPIKTAIQSNNIRYQVLIIDKSQLTDKLKGLHKKVRYIDYVIPAPLLYKPLFSTKKINSVDSFVFIHFGDYDSFVTFYHRGEYLYSKSIKFSLDQMYDRFCQLAHEVSLTKEQFRTLLANDGLKNANSAHKELLVRVINECFLTINDVVIYTKRAYEIDNFKMAYISFDWGYIDGIELYVQNYLNLNSKPLVAAYSNEDPKVAVNPMHVLMKMNTDDSASDVVNLTPYPKPLPFFKRPAGKMISAFILVSLLGLVPIVYDTGIALTYKTKNTILEPKARKLTAEKKKYEKLIKESETKLENLNKAVEKIKQVYHKEKGQVENVYNKKFKYRLRSEQLALLTKLLKAYGIQSKDIKVESNTYFIEVESSNEKKITEFIKNVVAKFNKDISKVEIDEISFDKENSIYRGVLKVEFRKGIK